MRLIYHPGAEAELIESARFYEQQVPSLGGQFLDAAELSVGAILDAPERWSIIEAGVRRYLMPRFPFAVYYRIWPDHLRILAFGVGRGRENFSWEPMDESFIIGVMKKLCKKQASKS